jgi:hypothetical protein
MNAWFRWLGIVVFLLPISACTPSQIATTSTLMLPTEKPTSTSIPTSTATRAPPTPTLTSIPPTPTLGALPGLIPEGIEVTFSKSLVCEISGPTEFPSGEYTFVLRDQTDKPRNIQISSVIEGLTAEDFLNHPLRKDGNYWSGALDLLEDVRLSGAGRNEARNEFYYTFILDEGEYLVIRWTQTKGEHFFWYCGSILVQ